MFLCNLVVPYPYLCLIALDILYHVVGNHGFDDANNQSHNF